MREGWNAPKPEHIPRPTSWPAGFALGIALVGWGIITSPVLLGVGALVFAASLWGWIGEIRHDR